MTNNLAHCWLIIEAFVIPHGFLKWFFLSFYIHPFFLFFCQIFLWLNFIFLFYLQIISFLYSYVFLFLKNCVNHQSYQTEEEEDHTNHIINSYSYSCSQQVLQFEKYYVFEEELGQIDQVSYEDDSSSIYGSESSDQYMASLSSSSSSSICSSDSAVANNLDMNECSSLVLISSREPDEYCSAYICSYNSFAMVETEDDNGCYDQGQDVDEVYDKYNERMGWFDVLNYNRTCAIMKNEIENPISSESERKMNLRSIERDMELVYVAQSCLSWEALNHQYLKVEALAQSTSGNGVFYNNVAGDFQKFQVILERFMEDERCFGRRIHNFVTKRFHLNTFLQVPNVSGFMEEEKDEMKKEGTSVGEVVKAIERCIEAFWVFVNTDEKKKRWWKFRNSFWSCPPVEDPRDLYLFAHLTTQLRKKELWLKDSQGKQKCWIRRVENSSVEESQRKEMLFTKIDMKLISKVLQLPLVSSSQLKWCHQKLQTIHFHQGKIVRPSSTSSPLFPP
ncbi:uncharacterized protein [Euphorbia lathyris]|uniref:uncharacterized protein n=1 Tax=Euphorbia lathyris TaxID=212925 RepID=UPI003313E44D